MIRTLTATLLFGAALLSGAAAHAAPLPGNMLAQVPKTASTPLPTVEIPPALPPIIKLEAYVEAGYIVPPIICNEFSPCNPGLRYRSSDYRGAIEFPLAGPDITAMIKADYRIYGYSYNGNGPVKSVGNGPGYFAPPFEAREYDMDLRAGIRALEPRLYLGVSYLRRGNNYGYPTLRGYGIGLEKLPDVDQTFSVYGGAYYYPSVKATYFIPNGGGATSLFAYHILRYDLGITLKPSDHSPLFIDAGYVGDRSRNAGDAPGNQTRNGPFVGVGITFP
ncbi:MAG: hypothetical protein M3M96_00710 [Candidatus Eremiobacteraeota bacterium]|nr:hypothetical protein [Candidatus Eremiobacteraeota bacterium]